MAGLRAIRVSFVNDLFAKLGFSGEFSMGVFRFCTAIIGLIILTIFFACSGTLNHPGASTARAADMPDSHKGIASPNPRFTDNRNGTVTDDLTGLI